jgi:outer membrane protein W
MNRLGWSQACVSAAVSLVLGLTAAGARAESSDDSLSLKIASALRSDRLFVRAGVIFAKIKTKSGDTKDVTGPVISTNDLKNVFYSPALANEPLLPGETFPGDTILEALIKKYPSVNFDVNGNRPIDNFYELGSRDIDSTKPDGSPNYHGAFLYETAGIGVLTKTLDATGSIGLGTPPGITGVASPETGTAGISLGYYLTDDYSWVVETYVLAAPLSTSVNIRGQVPKITAKNVVETDSDGNVVYRPIAINGQKIITSKLLPPIVMLGRYWGDKNWRLRPYTGVAGMYAFFYDTKATQALNSYVGGSNPGDTTVSIKNTFGYGPVLGLKYSFDDTWHASLNVGHVKLKTVATLTTRNTFFKTGDAILSEFGEASTKIADGESAFVKSCVVPQTAACDVARANGGLTTLISKAVSNERGSSNLGTFVRKTETELTNTIFMLSVGRTF